MDSKILMETDSEQNENIENKNKSKKFNKHEILIDISKLRDI